MPRLSFTLRDVLWLTLVVGMGVAWWADRSRERRNRLELLDDLESQRALISAMDEALNREQRTDWTFRKDATGKMRFVRVPETKSVGQP
jgi:hypothetical protein